MEVLTQAEENYLKAVFKITENDDKAASTNAIAAAMSTTAASVTDMLKRLSGKGLCTMKNTEASFCRSGEVSWQPISCASIGFGRFF